jgi:hypothetical protein
MTPVPTMRTRALTMSAPSSGVETHGPAMGRVMKSLHDAVVADRVVRVAARELVVGDEELANRRCVTTRMRSRRRRPGARAS